MKNDITSLLRRQVAALALMDLPALRAKFEELHGFPCPNNFPDNLRRRITLKLQEIYIGGLDEEDAAFLDSLAEKDPLSRLESPAPARRMSRTPGTRYQRVWKGRTYEVKVLQGGMYEYDGKEYKSLSAIAGIITGGHWNGKLFFGVK